MLELNEAAGEAAGNMVQLRRVIMSGCQRAEAVVVVQDVSFEKALRCCLEEKSHRAAYTLRDIRQTMGALMRAYPELARVPIAELNAAQCREMLQGCFGHSPTRMKKARDNLSGVFSVAIRHEWCANNPINKIAEPRLQERQIKPLSMAQMKCLMSTAHQKEHVACLPAAALMLYAGIRPEELRRLSWGALNWEERELRLAARHSQPGGARCVPLWAPVLRGLRAHRPTDASLMICPPNWVRRWRHLRQQSGFERWVPDVLRHTYASYHVKHFRDLPALQLAMGHRDPHLLYTRYINLEGVTRKNARAFWAGEVLRG